MRALSLGEEGVTPGAGLELFLYSERGARWGVALLGAVQAAVPHVGSGAELELQPVALRLSPTVESPLAGPIRLFAGVTGGADVFSVHYGNVPSNATLADRSRFLSWILGWQAGARFHAGARYELALGGGLDLDITPKSYEIEVGGERRPAFEVPSLRPWLMLTASFALISRSRS